jgi:hypothetical protein
LLQAKELRRIGRLAGRHPFEAGRAALGARPEGPSAPTSRSWSRENSPAGRRRSCGLWPTLCRSRERIGTIETAFELLLHTLPEHYPNVAPMQARAGGGEPDPTTGQVAGARTVSDLLIQAFTSIFHAEGEGVS